MKKIISIIMSTVIVFLSCGIYSIAINIENEISTTLDLSQYTMQDIANMSAEEYRMLLADFERVYDPFSTYQSDRIMEEVMQDPTVDPLWSSGNISADGEYAEVGSHELISSKACELLNNDLGFFGDNATENIAIALSISLASLLPDKDEKEDLYEGHFYNPYTDMNYNEKTDNTAKTNFVSHFNAAVQAYSNNNEATAFEELGRALHYIQDASQPMHVSDYTNASLPIGNHSAFEQEIDKNIDSYLSGITSVLNHNFHGAKQYGYSLHTSNYYIKECALTAYEFKDCTNTAIRTRWAYAANITVQNAAAFSAITMYIFSRYAKITLS